MKYCLAAVLFVLNLSVNAATVTLTPSDDASVTSGIDDVNENAFYLNVYNSNTITRHTFIKFDLSDHSDDVTGDDITSATLRVYIQNVPRAGEVTFAIPNVDWNEDALTGNDYPTSFSNSSYATADIAKTDKGTYLEIDITDIAQDWFDGGANYGVAILPTSGGDARVRFGSQRISSKQPQVVMETTDTLSVAFEPFNKNLVSTYNLHEQDTMNYFQRFEPLTKTRFTKAKIHLLPSDIDGVLGVAIYSENNDGEPATVLASSISDWGFWSYNNEELEFVFDAPVTLRPNNRYFFAFAYSMMCCQVWLGKREATYNDVHYRNPGASAFDIYSGGEFEDNPGLYENTEDVIWFRLIP